MTKPIFAQGKEFEYLLTLAAPAGSHTFHLNSPGSFSLGDRIFCSESDGTLIEYLGVITSIEASAIVVAFPLVTARSYGAAIWRADEFHPWETVACEPVKRVLHEGIAVERAIGGTLWSVRVADPVQEVELRFAGITPTDFADFRSWISEVLRGGLDNFTWVDENLTIATVRLLDLHFEITETAPEALTLTIRLGIIEEGGYV